MRLLKLLAYCILGYVLYEIYQGMKGIESQQAMSGGGGGQRSSGGGGGRQRDQRGRFASGSGGAEDARNNALMNPGQGERAETLDSDGGSTTHRVARGVVSR